MDEVRRLGTDCEALAASFAHLVFRGRVAGSGAWPA
jgi:hypothetical protein